MTTEPFTVGSYKSPSSPARLLPQQTALPVTRQALAAAGEEPLEPWMAPHRIERRVEPEPPGREVERNSEQRLELVEGLVRFAGQEIDPDELELEIGAEEGVALDREQLDPPPALANRLRLPSQVGERHAQNHVALGVLGLGPALRLE